MGRQAQSSGQGADAARLRQQLVHARAEIADLQEELQEKNNLYLNAIKERDAGTEKLNSAKESLNRFEDLVKLQVCGSANKAPSGLLAEPLSDPLLGPLPLPPEFLWGCPNRGAKCPPPPFVL